MQLAGKAVLNLYNTNAKMDISCNIKIYFVQRCLLASALSVYHHSNDRFSDLPFHSTHALHVVDLEVIYNFLCRTTTCANTDNRSNLPICRIL